MLHSHSVIPAATAGDIRCALWIFIKLYQTVERDHVNVVLELL